MWLHSLPFLLAILPFADSLPVSPSPIEGSGEEDNDPAPTLPTPSAFRNSVVETEVVRSELSNHFDIQKDSLDELGSLLLKVKQLAHRQVYGDRVFSRDSAVDSKKPVSISPTQPKTKPELTPYLFEGDIFLTERQATSILNHLAAEEEDGRKPRSLTADPKARWTKFPIRYRFHDSMTFFAIKHVVTALDYWQNQTCVRFRHVPEADDKPDGDYIEFFKGQGCYSMIGRYGSRQGISIGEGCERTGIVEHEVGHALGLWHEQSRPDAGAHVEVEKDFILPSYMSDFQQRGTDEIDDLGLPYDYGSVMHYGSTAFSSDGTSRTLLTLDPLFQSTIGQREKLSFLDVKVINKAYCEDKCSDKAAKCANGGYPHPNRCSTCLCPGGYGGITCEEHEPPIKAKCGGVIKLDDKKIVNLTSPGYDDDGYVENQFCAWVITAPKGMRVQYEFVEDFGFLCATTCVDYVEIKLGKDQRLTGPRFCCFHKPDGKLVSDERTSAVLFRSQASQDVGFKLTVRATNNPPEKPEKRSTTTTPMPTTIAGTNILSEWGPWSACSKPCGGCGIRSRVRTCQTAECDDKTQEFDTCNMQACPVSSQCQKVFFINRLCEDKVCSQFADAPSECNAPTCCPPFSVKDGICVGDDSAFDFP